MQNIFDYLHGTGVKWRVWDYRVDEDVAFVELERELKADPRGFYLLYTAGLDAEMHAHGTLSERVEKKLEYYRERIERIVRACPYSRIAVLGDHGMCDVDGTLDLISLVDSLDRKTRDGFIPFYDSTMARFRVLRESAGRELEDLLSRIDAGSLLDRESLERLGVFFPDGRFGDIIFLADRGKIILPSFMSSKRLAAMHGYDPDAPCMFAVMLANFDIDQHEIDLKQIAPLIVPGFKAGDSL
jgi:predicted AlkP superfamily pyrophosphatase or phosphodiesterase